MVTLSEIESRIQSLEDSLKRLQNKNSELIINDILGEQLEHSKTRYLSNSENLDRKIILSEIADSDDDKTVLESKIDRISSEIIRFGQADRVIGNGWKRLE